eukprot:Selendium_serpulae@DN5717_c0_g1_i4.p1
MALVRTWSGEVKKVDCTKDKTGAVVTSTAIGTKIKYDPDDECWTIRETTTMVDGPATVLHFRLTPVSDGLLTVDIGRKNPELPEAQAFLREHLTDSTATFTESLRGGQLVHQDSATGALVGFDIFNFTEE